MAYMVCILYILIIVDWANLFPLTVMDSLVATQATAPILVVDIARKLTMSKEAMSFCRHRPSSLALLEPSEVKQADLHKVSAGRERERETRLSASLHAALIRHDSRKAKCYLIGMLPGT